MLRRLLRLSVIGIYLISAGPAAAQVPITVPSVPSSPLASSTTAVQTTQPPAPPADPLGRSNPRSMLREFIRAVDRNDFVSAARYMQLTKVQQPHAELLARYIRELMNCCFDQPLATISDADTGALDDGLPLDQERIGPLKIGNHRADIILVHVNRPDGSIWLISSMTLEQVPGTARAHHRKPRRKPDAASTSGAQHPGAFIGPLDCVAHFSAPPDPLFPDSGVGIHLSSPVCR